MKFCPCSIRTLYRLLEARGESRERRDQLTHPPYQKHQQKQQKKNNKNSCGS
ncbi:MAG: hypothetical protein JO099_01890 [Acidobacteriia bacterium]|nr:hypothetical protein [Terriglobia bacterium]